MAFVKPCCSLGPAAVLTPFLIVLPTAGYGAEIDAPIPPRAERVSLEAESHGLQRFDTTDHSQIWFSDSLVRDLTGDGIGDTIIVLATGNHPDTLEVILRIIADGYEYKDSWTSEAYRGPEGYWDPDPLIRNMLHPNHFSRLDPDITFLSDFTLGFVAEQIGGSHSEAENALSEIRDLGMPLFSYREGYVITQVAWSPSRRQFIVLARMG